MLHGNPTWSFLYRGLIDRLRSRFRCVAPDLPGFGLSTAAAGYGFTAAEHAEIVAAFVAALGLRDVVVVGQDWGGPIGLDWATRNPDEVRGVVLGNTWAWPLTGQRRFEVFSAVMGGAVGRSLTWLFNFVPRFFLHRGHSAPLTSEERRAWLAPLRGRRRRRPATVFPRELIAAAPFLSRLEARLHVLREKPALLLWGARDFAFREPELRRLQRALPRHVTLQLSSSSHFWQEDSPDEAAAAIANWAPST